MAEYDDKNPRALSKLLQSGVKLQAFSNEILEGTYKAAQQLYSDESAKNPAFKKIYTEWDKYRKTENAWFSLAEARLDNFLQSHK
jgi:TRAP-type mannitol/chloroaromatic compound transport system substrate-binding protein